MRVTLDKNTLMPMGAVIAMMGGIAWLTEMYLTANANAKDIQKIELQQSEYRQQAINFQREAIERLSRIEGKLDERSEDKR